MTNSTISRLKRAGIVSVIAAVTVLTSCTSEFCPAYAHGRQRMSHGKQQYASKQRTSIPMPGSTSAMKP